VKPSTPPAWPGSCDSHWYRRVHSSAQLAAISSARPIQKAARGSSGARRWLVLAAHRPGQADSQARRRHRHEPPDRIAEQEQAQVGHPGTEQAGLVAQRLAVARGGEARVAEVVRHQASKNSSQASGADEQQGLLAPARERRRRRRSGRRAG
jgi:hypothetical protein